MAGMQRTKKIEKPLPPNEVKYRAGVIVRESCSTLRHILRFEDNPAVVAAALAQAEVLKDERKVRLLMRRARLLDKRKVGG